MPLVDYATYSAGFMPSADVAAQERCFKYLQKTIELLAKRVDTSLERQDDNAQLSLLRGVRGVTEAAAGTRRWKSAATFWRYWDKNKERIIKLQEDTDDQEVVLDQIGVLEDGRYYDN